MGGLEGVVDECGGVGLGSVPGAASEEGRSEV